MRHHFYSLQYNLEANWWGTKWEWKIRQTQTGLVSGNLELLPKPRNHAVILKVLFFFSVSVSPQWFRVSERGRQRQEQPARVRGCREGVRDPAAHHGEGNGSWAGTRQARHGALPVQVLRDVLLLPAFLRQDSFVTLPELEMKLKWTKTDSAWLWVQ